MKRTQTISLYHAALRTSAILVLALLIFDSGFISPVTKQLSDGTQAYVATVVGMSASVEPTELNTWTAALTAKETELNRREAALNDREISVDLDRGVATTAPDVSIYVLSIILFIILVLIALNYALDVARYRQQQALIGRYEQKA
ncbi:hypothetical protein KC722_01360 [Candidatus Kaiserbacteria bacterium]|nr:hypothetical protein [Candidatus Kaiserbacteria bacterium]MCB9811910.1 hypothetical protein [Candidatus Nomurabacteria bacterium]